MKIYDFVRIDILTGAVLEERSRDYSGPVAECKGGGGSSKTVTVDKEYNARMASIAEQEAALSQEFMNMYKYGVDYDPTETVTGYYDQQGHWHEGSAPAREEQGYYNDDGQWVTKDEWVADAPSDGGAFAKMGYMNTQPDWQTRMNPEYEEATRTRGEIQGYDPDTASQMDLEQAQLAANMAVVPLQEKVGKKFYQRALGGINADERVNQARADVAQGFEGAAQKTARDLGRYGINPNSGRGRDAFSTQGLEYGRQMAGASTAARRSAEDDEFRRLGGAIQTIR